MYLKMVNAMAKNKMGTPYLHFDGVSYFDLGVVPDGDFKMEITARPLSASSFMTVGQQTAWNVATNRFAIGKPSNNSIWFSNPTAYNNFTFMRSDYINSKHTFYLSKSEIGVDEQKRTMGNGSLGTFDMNMFLGTTQEELSSGQYSLMDFFRLKCWRNDLLVADIVPFANNQIKNLITGDIRLNLGTGVATLYYE